MNAILNAMIALATKQEGIFPTRTSQPRELPEWKQKDREDRRTFRAAPDIKTNHFASLHSEPIKFKRPKIRRQHRH